VPWFLIDVTAVKEGFGVFFAILPLFAVLNENYALQGF
jgi:hypothetical protein